jgi:ABC-type glutathione transport system ATPase component
MGNASSRVLRSFLSPLWWRRREADHIQDGREREMGDMRGRDVPPEEEQPQEERSYSVGSKPLGENVVVLKKVGKAYSLPKREERVIALRDITMHPDSEIQPIRRGEFVMLRGPSGGGKTTLLNIVGCIDQCTSGTVELFGQVIDSKATDQ